MKDNMRFVTKGLSGFNLPRAKTQAETFKGHSKSWLIVMLLVVLMAGCNGSSSLDSSPAVTLTTPASDATGVATNTKIVAAFSEEMDSTTITATTFTLKQGATAVTGTVTYSGVTAVFAPANDLTAFTTYTATITAGAKNKIGNAIASEYVWSFTTGAAPDTTTPTVTLTIPAAGATGVATNTEIVAAFSEEMDATTITATTFTLKHGATAVTGTVTYSGTAVFAPASDLLPSTTYTATITTGAKDLAGNALAAGNNEWSFTTVAAGALSVSPATLTYANQTVGTTSVTQTVTISNTGGTVLTVSSITLGGTNPGDFVLVAPATPLTINAGAIQTFTVAFKPAATGAKSAAITVASTAGNATVSAIGTGVTAGALSVSTTELQYDDTAVDSASVTQTVTITNTGGAPLTVNSITNSNTADFDLVAPTTPLTINAGASQIFTVAFSPAALGARNATITVSSTSGSATVSATGTGI